MKTTEAWKSVFESAELSPEAKQEICDRLSFTPYVGIDLGFNDFTAFLFGYYDFLGTTLVIEDELLLNGKNSADKPGSNVTIKLGIADDKVVSAEIVDEPKS